MSSKSTYRIMEIGGEVKRVHWVATDHYSKAKKKRKQERLSRRKNRG